MFCCLLVIIIPAKCINSLFMNFVEIGLMKMEASQQLTFRKIITFIDSECQIYLFLFLACGTRILIISIINIHVSLLIKILFNKISVEIINWNLVSCWYSIFAI